MTTFAFLFALVIAVMAFFAFILTLLVVLCGDATTKKAAIQLFQAVRALLRR